MPADHGGNAAISERLRRTMAEAGIGQDDPLAPLIEALADTAEQVRRGPDPEMERGIAQRVSAGIVAQVSRLSLAVAAAVGAGALALGIGIGWWIGSAQPVVTSLGPLNPAVLRLLQANDLAAALDRCTPIPQPSGRACAVAVWLEPPAPQAQR